MNIIIVNCKHISYSCQMLYVHIFIDLAKKKITVFLLIFWHYLSWVDLNYSFFRKPFKISSIYLKKQLSLWSLYFQRRKKIWEQMDSISILYRLVYNFQFFWLLLVRKKCIFLKIDRLLRIFWMRPL